MLAHHPMIVSGFDRIQADPVDPRLINYILEHTYGWLTGAPLHEKLWDPPIYYPTPNVLAYSDTFLTAAPFYWSWRAVGLAPDTAYQLWVLTASTLNFLTMALFLRRGLTLSTCGALAGAFLFAFAAPRVNQIAHPQLYTQYFSVLTLHALVLALTRRADPTWKRALWWCLASLGLAAQTYASFYLAWFLVLGLALAFPGVLAFRSLRRPLFSILRQDPVPIVASGIIGGLAVWPLFHHAKAAATELGYRTFHEALISLPDWFSWLYQGPETWLYGWQTRPISLEGEHRLGIGLITPLAVAFGLYLGRGPVVRVATLGMLGLWLCVTRFGSEIVLNLSILTLALNVTWLILNRMNDRNAALLTVSSVILTAVLVPGSVFVLVGPVLVVALVATLYLERKGYGARLWPYVLATFIAFFCFVTYSDTFTIWGPGTLGVVAASMMLQRGSLKLSAYWLAVLGLTVAAVFFLFGDQIMVWKYFFRHLFGANAIRAVGRASLVLLIPASVGLALTFDFLWRRGQWLAIGLLALICVLEQGLTTSSYDKWIQRQNAHAVAVRVPATAAAYFAGVLGSRDNAWETHLDAMWAELECHVPTINGYSGGQPKGWDKFYLPQPGSGDLLITWAKDHGLNPQRICWIFGWPENFGLMLPKPVIEEDLSPQTHK